MSRLDELMDEIRRDPAYPFTERAVFWQGPARWVRGGFSDTTFELPNGTHVRLPNNLHKRHGFKFWKPTMEILFPTTAIVEATGELPEEGLQIQPLDFFRKW